MTNSMMEASKTPACHKIAKDLQLMKTVSCLFPLAAWQVCNIPHKLLP